MVGTMHTNLSFELFLVLKPQYNFTYFALVNMYDNAHY